MKKKRILALILSVAMLVGIMPKLTLFASETETADTATVYVDGTNGSDDAAVRRKHLSRPLQRLCLL